MKLTDIRGKDSRELRLDIRTLRTEAFKLAFRSSTEDVVNPSRHREIRRTIARIRTILREREIEQAAKAVQST
jgi:large subunit ribosomal protein L29